MISQIEAKSVLYANPHLLIVSICQHLLIHLSRIELVEAVTLAAVHRAPRSYYILPIPPVL